MKKVILSLVMMLSATVVFAGELVIATSDYESGNTAVYDTKTDTFIPAAQGQDDQDVIVDSDGKYVYFLSRSLGSVAKYNPSDIGSEAANGGLIWQYSVGTDSNPYDIAFLDSKAYVIRYGSPEILVVNQNTDSQENFELGTIDISAFDENGAPEAAYGFVYDNMVYVVLQRLDGWSVVSPGYLLKIDPTTDTIVDLDSETEGVQGLELLVSNPQYFSQNGSLAYIGGHDWSGQTEGVQAVDLSDPDLTQTMILDEETLFMDITGVKVFDTNLGIFYSASWVQEGDDWVQVGSAYWFDPSTGAIGEVLPVPTPDGGAVKVDNIVYVGSRDSAAPGVYMVDPSTNSPVNQMLATSLPPTSMVFFGDDIPTVVAEGDAVPESFELRAPYPNPFNPATTVSFTLSSAGMTTVDVFNLAGQKVATLANEVMSAGNHAVV